jgi:alkylation response protein AidB-like acyl-CoA dehydrogenase
MDFRFSEKAEAFRKEIQNFIKETLPADWRQQARDPQKAKVIFDTYNKKARERGYHTMAWPKEFGGQERSIEEQLVANLEVSRQMVPPLGGGIGWIGPMIMMYGTEEQKKRYVPKIVNGEERWCTLYSEPNAGSDLAGLQTRAAEDGDFYVVNGQKIWTSGAHMADWGLLACRTDPEAIKHRGISIILVPMKSPGITVRPLVTMADVASFNQVFFDNVRVPKGNLLGEKNRGWQMMREGLKYERSWASQTVTLERFLVDLLRYTKETAQNGSTLSKKPRVRQQMADLFTRLEVGRLLSYRVVWMREANKFVSYESNIDKLYNSELFQRSAGAGMEMEGLWGQLTGKDPLAPLGGNVQQNWRGWTGFTIAAGTSEVQRNSIAQGLGLPRSYDP